MDILMLTMSMGIGGAETHILELARELSRRGHTVTVASAGGVFVEPLTAAGVRHVYAPLHTKNPVEMARAMRILRKLLRDSHFDVIHAHARIPGFLADRLAKQFDIPMVTTFHYTFDPVWYLRMFTRVGERTLAVSDDLKEYLMHYYHTPKEKIGITVNGIDVDQFDTPSPETRAAVRAELSLPDGEQILCVTRLDAAVAWHAFRLMEAMPEIVAERPHAHLTVVGGGDAMEEARRTAAEINARLGGEYITLLGARHDIAHILASADIFVGVSRAAMEAMACRLPVVLTGAQGHLGVFVPALEAEAVETNFCCRTRERADAETIARAVITLLSASEEERRQMGEYNRSVVRRLYSVGRMAGDAEKMYEQARREHLCRRPQVLISGYYGFGNTGDDALLTELADGLRSRGVYRIAALSHDAKNPPAPGVRGVARMNVCAVWRALRQADLLLSGGGSLLQDATSTKSLLYYTGVMRTARWTHTPVMIYANGVGPLSREKNRRRAARAVMRADYVSVRESASARLLSEMGVPAERIAVTADPVYRGAPLCAPRGDYVVLSLRDTADGHSSAAAEEAAVRALTEVCRSHSLRVLVLPMQEEYDREICARAAARLSDAGVETEIVRENVRGVIAGARAVVAMRLHALIFATAAAVPVIALSYDPKIDALMEDLGMSAYVLSAYEAGSEILSEKLTGVLADSESISAALSAQAAEFSTRAERDLDAVRMLLQG